MRDCWTEEDLADLPQDGTRYEIADGRLYRTPLQGESHQAPLGALLAVLRAAAPAPKADNDYNDVETIKPALVVEVASRSTETIDRGNKMIVYAKAGDG